MASLVKGVIKSFGLRYGFVRVDGITGDVYIPRHICLYLPRDGFVLPNSPCLLDLHRSRKGLYAKRFLLASVQDHVESIPTEPKAAPRNRPLVTGTSSEGTTSMPTSTVSTRTSTASFASGPHTEVSKVSTIPKQLSQSRQAIRYRRKKAARRARRVTELQVLGPTVTNGKVRHRSEQDREATDSEPQLQNTPVSQDLEIETVVLQRDSDSKPVPIPSRVPEGAMISVTKEPEPVSVPVSQTAVTSFRSLPGFNSLTPTTKFADFARLLQRPLHTLFQRHASAEHRQQHQPPGCPERSTTAMFLDEFVST